MSTKFKEEKPEEKTETRSVEVTVSESIWLDVDQIISEQSISFNEIVSLAVEREIKRYRWHARQNSIDRMSHGG